MVKASPIWNDTITNANDGRSDKGTSIASNQRPIPHLSVWEADAKKRTRATGGRTAAKRERTHRFEVKKSGVCGGGVRGSPKTGIALHCLFVRRVGRARQCTQMSGIKFWCERGTRLVKTMHLLIPSLYLPCFLYYISIRDPGLMRCWVPLAPLFPCMQQNPRIGDRGRPSARLSLFLPLPPPPVAAGRLVTCAVARCKKERRERWTEEK